MSIGDYKGAANTPDCFKHLVGSTIKACFHVRSNGSGGMDTYIVDESGCALVFYHATGAYWVASKSDVDAVIALRRAEIAKLRAELNDLHGVDLGEAK